MGLRTYLPSISHMVAANSHDNIKGQDNIIVFKFSAAAGVVAPSLD